MAVVKNNNLSASLEDYLEAIFNIAGTSKIARSKDISELLGVSKSSVTGALRLLKKKGFVNYKPYDNVTLTEDGQTAAAEVVRKHNILKSFFVNVLGVEPDEAQKAACKAEHALGLKIISKLLSYIAFVNESNKNGYNLAEQFREFCKQNNRQG